MTDSAVDPERVAKLMQGAGICVHHYQHIEAHLKLLLPMMLKPGSAAPDRADFEGRAR